MTRAEDASRVSSSLSKLVTPRLDLVPATASLVRAEMEGPRRLRRLLDAWVPEAWPPGDLAEALPVFRERLERQPELAGWFSWYWVLVRPEAPPAAAPCRPGGRGGGAPVTEGRIADCGQAEAGDGALVLIGGGGFHGPTVDGSVEIGYHVVRRYRRRGYATEALLALLVWAFSHDQVRTVLAETAPDNAASLALLLRLGFARSAGVSPEGLVRWVMHEPSDAVPRAGS